MNEHLKSNLTSSKLWVRLVYMLLFSFFLYIASFVVIVLIVGQFLFALLTGEDNKKLRHFGNSISIYIKDVLMFLSFNSEFKAFPFADWPEPDPLEASEPYSTVEVVTDEVVAADDVVEAEVVTKTDDLTVAEETTEKNTTEGNVWGDPELTKRVDPGPASSETSSDTAAEKNEKRFGEQSSDTSVYPEQEKKTEEPQTDLEKNH